MTHTVWSIFGSLRRLMVVAALPAHAAVLVFAQTQPPAQSFAGAAPSIRTDLICVPHVVNEAPVTELRLISSQDPATRLLYAPGDTVVVNGGSATGVRADQQYFVRRLQKRFGAKGPDRDHPVVVHTAGWIKILAVDERLATATVVHACDGMVPGDYLEPFVPPVVREPAAGREVRYEDLAQIVGADEQRTIAAANEYMVIDRGSDHGVASGTRFLVLRDKRTGGPLVEIGEGIVLTVKAETATVQILKSRDAVMSGDFVAMRK